MAGKPKTAGLVAGCDFRRCDECGTRVFVPRYSDWSTCLLCRRGTERDGWQDDPDFEEVA